ncbi:MAG: hypothetical protein ABI301_05695 [Jatrophihabitantaceae bacterium]
MRSVPLRPAAMALATSAALAAGVAGCTSGHVQPGTTSTQTRTATVTTTPSSGPIAAGPTTTASGTCSLLPRQTAANDLGMRLAKERVLVSGGKQIGCEFFAIQDSPLATSERLPGPNQPVLRITAARYASEIEAHNAMVLLAEAGTNAQQVTIAPGNIGLAFQTDFYPPDHGTDWACTFNQGTTLVIVYTVVTRPALDAIEIAKAVAGKL